jgi:NAD(P)-dependent dehydrogenase (short-subunit alcohol dehydrogenase family)
MKEFRGRVAVVTGAASGIGRALAARFAAEGMKVVLADVEQRALAAAEADLRARGATVLGVLTDVAVAGDVDALARKTLDAFGGVHVLCNNAGVVAAGPTWERSIADWEWVLGVNLWGVIHGIRAFVPIMLEQDADAHVVNTASVAGLVPTAFNAPYTVSKFGVVALSECLRQELEIVGARVRVSVLCPGWVNTRILDAARNRPPALGGTGTVPAPQNPMEETMRTTVAQLLATGLAPDDVAAHVFEAIRDDRFWVLTHPEMTPMIRSRVEDILGGRNPAPVGFG